MPPPVKMPIRAVRAALVWFRKTTALDGKAGIGAGAAIDPVAPNADMCTMAEAIMDCGERLVALNEIFIGHRRD